MKHARATRAVLVASGAAIAAAGWALLRRRDDAPSGDAGRLFVLAGAAAPPLRDAAAAACCASCATGRNANGRAWRAPLGKDGRWAPWVYELTGRNGVYMIRPAGGGDPLYIGESHRARLMKTLTRHLWQWNGHGSGPTYDPRRVEVAVELFDEPADAVERQFELIRQLDPRDNVQDGHSLQQPADVPF